MSFRSRIDGILTGYFHRQFVKVLRKETRGCNSLLDLGCGYNTYIHKITKGIPRSVGVDVFMPSIEKARAAKTHSEFVLDDVMSYLRKQPDKSFDAIIALDLIEHLTKEDGIKLKDEMERVAAKKAIILTPNGFVPQRPYDNNPWQEHKSGWPWQEWIGYGYKLYGFAGYKALRGERGAILFKPRIFWKYFSFFTQHFTIHMPKYAFELMCVKTIQ